MSDNNKLFWSEFLQLYQSLPVLWKVKSEDYSNRVLKTKAYDIMIEKLKEIDPTANREKVTRKINSFRCNYRRDLRKIKQSEETAVGADDIYQSTLWYFDQLRFLDDQEDCLDEKPILTNNDSQTSESFSFQSCRSPDIPEPPKKRIALSREDPLVKFSCDHLKAAEDDATILAKGWSTQYNQLSMEQQIFARKIISDVFFYGCLGRLNENNILEIQSLLHKMEP